ncbi:4-hydroxy-3-methylbut-2-enyl diphosphate reductase [Candidatus Endolissoclinum faulkneri L5]|uniref:4-hydroxy-3-methylbut-2-enyl diphosphate reductase n=1 Tax=Candidatus Endolissoclinum faulkneri L5 TaxID=1401328 RepID=V9TSY8_9PROT|nr:4-hydroxy-3-methylbut-2-enyl diphosphate reductase [Candidatus Endolissoclinum faulkneri]AHC73262.1 4-hydroxy-3-methylbut-2-enyl diphosphate reductase [Candidatus Endolissoclinum faulkneri L5]
MILQERPNMLTVCPKQPITVVLASPRGFCAGVERAINIVQQALAKWGSPIYVRHWIVHNQCVVESLEAQGAVFVEDLDECPVDRPVMFSAHGVPQSVIFEAERRQITYIDATCPLVSKVHLKAKRYHRLGSHVILIGHAGHPEVIGTIGQLPDGAISLLENETQAKAFIKPKGSDSLALVTQTTLSVDHTARLIRILQQRFPEIALPKNEDICYATTNRQNVVKLIASTCDAVVVIGAQSSSNSRRLVEVAKACGCEKSLLIQRASDLDIGWLIGVRRLGLTAGASAPEHLVDQLIAVCRLHFTVTLEEVELVREDVHFRLPSLVA